MKKRNVAIIGCGQTKHSSRRRDVNVAELVSEAVYNALEDAQVNVKDVGAFVVGNMPGFGGVAQPEQWLAESIGAAGKPVIRIATGGSTGGSVGQGGYYVVASGLHDLVVAAAWEKHSDSKEPGATTGLMHVGMGNLFHALTCGLSLKNLIATTAVGAAAGVAGVDVCGGPQVPAQQLIVSHAAHAFRQSAPLVHSVLLWQVARVARVPDRVLHAALPAYLVNMLPVGVSAE